MRTTIHTPAGRLHLRARGSGPVVVLSSGLGGAWFDWDATVALLEPHVRVLVFDRPGTGGSGPALRAPSVAREVGVLDAVVGASGVGAAGSGAGPVAAPGARVVLVGHSMAALHVEAWARLRPGRVAGLVLVDPDPVAPGGGRPFDPASLVAGWALRSGAHRLSGRRWGAVLGWGGPLLRRVAMAVTTFGRQDRAPGRLVRRVYGRAPVGLAVLAELASFPEQVARVQELRAGTALPDVPFEVLAPAARPELAAIAGMSARGRLVVVPGSRHMVHVDRPDAVALAVLRAAGLR